MDCDTNKQQCPQNTSLSDAISSAGNEKAKSLLPSEKESGEKTAVKETDACGVAAASSNKANTDTATNSRDFLMSWVKDWPVHLLAAYFQRMPPWLKLFVEITNDGRLAEIMEVHGWAKWDRIDIVLPADSSGMFLVNGSVLVEIGDVVECVQFLFSRISVRHFLMKVGTDGDEWDSDDYSDCEPDHEMDDVTNALVNCLLKSKDDGVAIKELRLDVPGRLLKCSTIGDVIVAFCESLTHISVPITDGTGIAAIGKCEHLESLEYGRPGQQSRSSLWEETSMKDALASKTSLKRLFLGTPLCPWDILVAGVHHLNHLAIVSFEVFHLYDQPTADDVSLMSELKILEIHKFSWRCAPTMKFVYGMAPKLERLHMAGNLQFTGGFFSGPGDLNHIVRHLADQCFLSRRSLTFSAGFKLRHGTEDEMMQYDKKWVTARDLSHYGVMAFDERLHKYDYDEDVQRPPTSEHPLHITSIDGSRVYKRVFKINVTCGVHLSIGLEESPADPQYNY